MKTPFDMLVAQIGEKEAKMRIWEFCKESNRIEGEDSAEYNDLSATMLILQAPEITEQVLFDAHTDYSVGSKLKPAERGAYRKIQVYVGNYTPPAAHEVAALMKTYLGVYKHLQSFDAHCRYEKIHPFVDFNGRTGRALWLRRALEEGYKLNLGFLHKFYYQTLSHYE